MKSSRTSSEPEGRVRPNRLVVDANPILSALISERSAASRIFWHPEAPKFATTEFTVTEVRRYLPALASKLNLSGELLDLSLRLLPLRTYDRGHYHDYLAEARQRIGERDPKDVDLLALALFLNAPVWSNDRDFEVAGVPVYSTAALLAALEMG